MKKTTLSLLPGLFLLASIGMATTAQAAEWSDTALSWRAGNDYREPFNPDDIKKNIFAITHASGYKYGSNFVNIDFLISDSKDPGALGKTAGAQEAYMVYRNTIDIGKVRGSDIEFGPVRGVGVTLGFDVNTKNDVGYNSRKRMLVAGPTLMWDVPGFFNTSLLLLRESNEPSGAFQPISDVRGRYTYKTHAMLTGAWAVPLSPLFSFEGFFNLIDSKGKDEVGRPTAVETNIDMQVMFDVGAALGKAGNTFRLGLEYQYWKNKFGNSAATTGNQGQTARTPMIRAEYHF